MHVYANSEVCAVELAECVTIKASYHRAFVLQEIRLEPVEEEVLESKSVSFKSTSPLFCCGDHSVPLLLKGRPR